MITLIINLLKMNNPENDFRTIVVKKSFIKFLNETICLKLLEGCIHKINIELVKYKQKALNKALKKTNDIILNISVHISNLNSDYSIDYNLQGIFLKIHIIPDYNDNITQPSQLTYSQEPRKIYNNSENNIQKIKENTEKDILEIQKYKKIEADAKLELIEINLRIQKYNEIINSKKN